MIFDLLQQVTKLKRVWIRTQSSKRTKKVAEYFPKLLSMIVSVVDQVSWLNDLWFKKCIQKCSLTHVILLITAPQYLKLMEMLKVQQIGISEECNKTLSWNKTIFKSCLKDHILQKLLHFSADITLHKNESYSLANFLKLKLSNGNLPRNFYKYSIHKLRPTPVLQITSDFVMVCHWKR